MVDAKVRRFRPVLLGWGILGGVLMAGAPAVAAPEIRAATWPVEVCPLQVSMAQPAVLEVPGVQVADEIVRRLRRLGLNFTKTRLAQPYDPENNIC